MFLTANTVKDFRKLLREADPDPDFLWVVLDPPDVAPDLLGSCLIDVPLSLAVKMVADPRSPQ